MLTKVYKMKVISLVTFATIYSFSSALTDDYCDKDVKDCGSQTRYLLYDVNPPEGFNLRRDVYMRYAVFARKLANSNDDRLKTFKLVLPPWSMLYHWRQKDEPEHIPWGLFFDTDSMKKFAPVVEMYEFFDEIGVNYGNVHIDEVYVLQHYQDMFNTGKFEERMSLDTCNGEVETNFFYYGNITSKNIRCLSFHGFTSQLTKILMESEARTILFDHGEVALHDRFGDSIYWKCRRSMRFNNELREISREFRAKFLNSTDENDGTVLPDDWRDEKSKRTTIGGPYLSVHMRRRDFVWGRPKHVPNLYNTAKQIQKKLNALELSTVFIATDAPQKEFEELKLLLSPDTTVVKFKPNKEVKKRYGEGGVAIIEQILCSHARHFLGTYESTYSFRIQEEREILGFPVETTFNRLCGNEEEKCEPTSKWMIEY